MDIEEHISDEGDLCDTILRFIHYLTCYNCGISIAEIYSATSGEEAGVIHAYPGKTNYPIAPDEPPGLYIECMKCYKERIRQLKEE